MKAACREAARHCAERGESLIKLAVQFAVAEPRIATTFVGSANPKNIESNIAWIDEPMDAALLAEVQRILAPVRNVTWPSGRPENN